MVLDCIDLLRSGVVRRNPDGNGDACPRHAPCVGAAVPGDTSLLVLLGLGRATRALPGPTISADAIQTGRHLVGPSDRLRHRRLGLLRPERRIRCAAQPICKLSAAWTVRCSLEIQVLQRAAFVLIFICINARNLLHPRFARANGSPANRDRASQRTTLQSTTRCAATA